MRWFQAAALNACIQFDRYLCTRTGDRPLWGQSHNFDCIAAAHRHGLCGQVDTVSTFSAGQHHRHRHTLPGDWFVQFANDQGAIGGSLVACDLFNPSIEQINLREG